MAAVIQVASDADPPYRKSGSMTRAPKGSPYAIPNEIVKVHVSDKLLKDNDVLKWEIWEKDVCTFQTTYALDEDVYFLEGVAVVTPQGGKAVTIKAGDYASMPANMVCEWNVVDPVRAHYREYEVNQGEGGQGEEEDREKDCCDYFCDCCCFFLAAEARK